MDPWYVEAFRADYLSVYPHRDLASARREARYLAEHGLRGRVLDLCCGFGRHSLALSEIGFDVIGVDLSADLLEHARLLAGSDRLSGRLVRADARRIPLAGAAADSVVNLFSSFGYFGDAGDRSVLDEIARVLRPEGRLVLDVMNPAMVRSSLVAESVRRASDFVIEERRTLLDGGRRVAKDVRVSREQGEVRTWREEVRLYESTELAQMLRERSLEILYIHGDFDACHASPSSPRLLVHARRRLTGP